MIEKVHALLNDFEERQSAGKIVSFSVRITPGGFTVQPEPAGTIPPESISLSPDLLSTLQIFFSDIDGISYNSYDYITLKSLLNAHGTLERMAQNAQQIKKTKP